MVRDPFLTKRTPHPDDVVKSVPAAKVGWTDEARAAAAAARSHGYSQDGKMDRAGLTHFEHPMGHTLAVAQDGSWVHDGPTHATMNHTGGFDRTHATLQDAQAAKPKGGSVQRIPRDLRQEQATGESAKELKAHLKDVHGKPIFKAVPDVARPPMPKTIEVDGDQDSLARTSQSTDPTDSFRVGYVTDAAEEGDDLMSPAPNPRDYGAFPLGKSAKDDMQDTLTCAAKKGWGANSPQIAGGGAVLSHPDLPGHHLHVAADGKWSHMGPHTPDGNPKMHGTGAGAGELKSHLRGLHQGLAKRGPRIV